jgi:hypothetical protein
MTYASNNKYGFLAKFFFFITKLSNIYILSLPKLFNSTHLWNITINVNHAFYVFGNHNTWKASASGSFDDFLLDLLTTFFTFFSIVAFHNLNEQIKIKTWVTHKEKREYAIKVHGGNIVDFVNLHKYMVITTSKSLVQIAKNRVFLSNMSQHWQKLKNDGVADDFLKSWC